MSEKINWLKISETRIYNLEEFNNFVLNLDQIWPEQFVLALNGPMAAGKTEFVKIFSEQKNVFDVSSPTFALNQNYIYDGGEIQHWDLYRIESEDEIESAGFWEQFQTAKPTSVFIEWAEKLRLWQIPDSWSLFRLNIEILSDQSRKLTLFKRLSISEVAV